MKIHAVGFGFMQPYCEAYAEFVEDPAEADFILSMNNAGGPGLAAIGQARATADRYDKPFCWWTIEDPNALGAFLPQAQRADYVFTSDRACIDYYRGRCKHQRVYWLPLAADPRRIHRPKPPAADAADFVLSCNWYDAQWEARRWATETLILPLARAGHSFWIHSYEPPPYAELCDFWHGGTDCKTVAEQYTHGRIVLGTNNQRTGMDGRGVTYMTSMRTFEALSCRKPFLSAQSDAYSALGFENGVHMVWVDSAEDALGWGKHLLDFPCQAAAMADAGSRFVEDNHTYGRRLERIMRATNGTANPEDWG